MATDQEISQALQAVLRESAGPKTTFSDVVQQLQSKLGGLDLSHKLDFIRSQIQLLFQPPPPQQHQQQKDHHHPFALPQQNPSYHHNPSPSAFHSFPPAHVPVPHPVPVSLPPQQPASLAPGKPDSHFVNLSLPEPAKESAQVKGKRKGGAGGLNKLCSVSPELQAIVGQPAMPRTEIVKQLWAYIRKNNLQDPNNKRKIICNDELRIVFETDCTDMFKMNKLLAKHISPLEPTKSQLKKQKVGAESTDDPSVQISEALASFFGVSEREMPRSDITKRIWEYINVNQLQDPRTMMILCDAKLQEIFGCESIRALDIPGVLGRHLVGRT
ncbi:SWI/SNF-related matrix-associated actin-dependent regulator of chromatin subfamily D member 1-like isoform X2 [Punica granatum]|uniref:SWI/SNF-related matrix-associated actin-dependent regulator of chromatin subfamily D member 1-like isoform X2 n=1 Tax=Punica granatum TaxID=22663 RepID=A0A6P8EH16_PUNGR|nr:SWI/SNF-related matrix-associated actin-dependent regulator of chromatin subfamily D member 1-like isoform X2 [Punica granatum]